MLETQKPDHFFYRTRLVYTWSRLLNTPFWALYALLPFIIVKDLNATAWQIACLISSKPAVSLISLYWSGLVKRRSDRLRSNIIWANLLGHIPFLFVPFVDHPWYYVFASACYMLFWRGANPAWMELLKINIPKESRQSVFAFGSAFYHTGGAILSLGIGWLLDDYAQSWRWLFPAMAILSISAVLLQISLPLKKSIVQPLEDVKKAFSFSEEITKPWKESWKLLQARPDFLRFQIGFMLGGGGLMLWFPVLPIFFFETLNLNFKELTLAMTFCKSVGYIAALPLWTRGLAKTNIFVFSSIVTALAAFFPISLLAAQVNLIFLYIAYLLYGAMQAGSEMSWNLSGPIFSKHEDSSVYSSVNVVTLGLRGCIAPSMGSFLCNFASATTALLIGGGLCVLATLQMYLSRQKENEIDLSIVNATIK